MSNQNITLHPQGDTSTNLYPNINLNNIDVTGASAGQIIAVNSGATACEFITPGSGSQFVDLGNGTPFAVERTYNGSTYDYTWASGTTPPSYETIVTQLTNNKIPYFTLVCNYSQGGSGSVTDNYSNNAIVTFKGISSAALTLSDSYVKYAFYCDSDNYAILNVTSPGQSWQASSWTLRVEGF